MQHLLEKKLFPYVIKPGRYTGGERGQIVKSPEGRLSVALGYPDMYEIGMSYSGLQILYNIINTDDRFLCERFFAPDKDAEKILRDENIPIFSLESYRPLGEFDIVGFTLSYEMVHTNLLNILDLAGIPLRASDRTENNPLIIAGGPATTNPGPTSDFIDIFYLGDAEENIIKILEIIKDSKELPRTEKLKRLAQEVPSVYIPEFYDRETSRPKVDFAPEYVKSARLKNLRAEYYPKNNLIPFIETIHDRLSVEIMRGCPRACRFCQATSIYRPVRKRPKDEIITQVYEQLSQTGYDEVSLLSLSSSDYPDIVPLMTQLAVQLQKKQIALSLPSLRPGTFTQALADAVKTCRKTGLTFAPEAGTERLRTVIRKDITDKQLYDTINLVFRNGWNLVKLYFMIGLPTETDEDIEGIVEMIRQVNLIGRNAKGKKIINITISPFSPKSHTPFQWDMQPSPEYIKKTGEYIRRAVKSPFVNIKLRDPNLSFLEGVIGRGGPEMGAVIETAFEAGARFDGWGERFDFELWKTAFEKNDLDPYQYLKGRPFSEKLPWSQIVLHVSTEQLIKERNRTSTTLKEADTEPKKPVEPETESNIEGGFGRSRKKSTGRTGLPPVTGNVRIRWGRKGLARFLSHRDNLRVFERAIRRSEIPIAFTQGFHPHMKMSFSPPLSIGYISEAEYLDLTLERPFQPDMAELLKAELPDIFFIVSTGMILNSKISLSGKLNRVEYQVKVEPDDNIKGKIDRFMALEKVEVTRISKGNEKMVDIRPAIYKLDYEMENVDNKNTGIINMELGIGTGGYAKPPEIIEAAKIIDKEFIPALLFLRKEMFFVDDSGNRKMPMEF